MHTISINIFYYRCNVKSDYLTLRYEKLSATNEFYTLNYILNFVFPFTYNFSIRSITEDKGNRLLINPRNRQHSPLIAAMKGGIKSFATVFELLTCWIDVHGYLIRTSYIWVVLTYTIRCFQKRNKNIFRKRNLKLGLVCRTVRSGRKTDLCTVTYEKWCVKWPEIYLRWKL